MADFYPDYCYNLNNIDLLIINLWLICKYKLIYLRESPFLRGLKIDNHGGKEGHGENKIPYD